MTDLEEPRCPADPDRRHVGLTTYDAKDPATAFPPIEPLRPPADAPNVLIVLLDDLGFGASSAFGGPCAAPVAERLAANGLEVHALPHDRPVRPDARRAPERPKPSRGRHGHDHRAGDLRARLHLDPSEHGGAAGRDPQAQRVLHGLFRQVP